MKNIAHSIVANKTLQDMLSVCENRREFSQNGRRFYITPHVNYSLEGRMSKVLSNEPCLTKVLNASENEDIMASGWLPKQISSLRDGMLTKLVTLSVSIDKSDQTTNLH